MSNDNVASPVDSSSSTAPTATSARELAPSGIKNVQRVIDETFDAVLKATRAAIDSETANRLKKEARDAYELAVTIGKNLGDVNKDGKLDADDLKAAADKAIAALESVGKIDPHLKTALLAGVVASAAMFLIPIVGPTLAIPAFASATAFFYLKAKLEEIKKK